MKILLIYPYPLYDRSGAHEEDITAVPVGLFYIGAILKEQGYDVEILNWSHIHKDPEKIVEALSQKRPDIVGFSILNANRWGGIEIARIAKTITPAVRIVFGGVAATFLWKHFLRHFPEIDYVVIGEGERSFLQLVQRIERSDFRSMENIDGIAFRKGKKIAKTRDAAPIKNLDALPIPAQYFAYQHVVSSRGCPGRCAFCGSPRLWGRKVRFRSAENFVQELEMLYSRGISFYYFSDDTFTLDKKRVVDICRKIIEKGMEIQWFAISRADCVNEEILCWMRKAGCIQISYGVESGSEKIRSLLGKDLKTEHVCRAFSQTHRHGILARAYFIYGSPQETWDTIDATVDLIRAIKPFICISYILEIYPGTKLYLDYQKKHGANDDIWLKRIEGISYFETDAGLSGDLVMAFGEKIRKTLYDNICFFVDSLELINKKSFFVLHADFCSRLGMTFSHGDYATNKAIKDKEKIAEKLYSRALGYAPDRRAFLGLGLLRQNDRDFQGAVAILEQGVACFPNDEELHLCLGINYMNLGRFQDALTCLLKFKGSPRTSDYIKECRKALTE